MRRWRVQVIREVSYAVEVEAEGDDYLEVQERLVEEAKVGKVDFSEARSYGSNYLAYAISEIEEKEAEGDVES